MVEVQARMLPALWSLLRPGGALLYMTCSLLRAENDAIRAVRHTTMTVLVVIAT